MNSQIKTGDRLVNAERFNCTELTGLTVENCYGLYAADDPQELIFLIIKLREQTLWQRFFLDAGIGFWEVWDEATVTDDMADHVVVDIGQQYALPGREVSRIVCAPEPDEQGAAAIWFDVGGVCFKMSFMDALNDDTSTQIESVHREDLPLAKS